MDHIDRNVDFLQVLEQGAMVVPCDFQQRLNLSQRYIGLDAVEQGAKPFP